MKSLNLLKVSRRDFGWLSAGYLKKSLGYWKSIIILILHVFTPTIYKYIPQAKVSKLER